MNYIVRSALKLSLILMALALYPSCRGQNHTSPSHVAVGDTVADIDTVIWSIFQDRQQNLWFGSLAHGVYRYDGKTVLNFSTRHGLCHNKVEKIEEDQQGNLYLTTPEGISRYDGQSFTTLALDTSAANSWKLAPDDLWFKGYQKKGTVLRYDGKLLHQLDIPSIKLDEVYYRKYPGTTLNPYDTYCIYKDTKGNIWFGTANMGACRYDGQTFDWISEDDVIELSDGPSNGVRSILEDRDGKFWFSKTFYRYGIYTNTDSQQIGQAKGTFAYRREKGPGSLDGKANAEFLSYLYSSAVKDPQGDLWLATYNRGIWHYNGQKFTHYPVRTGNRIIRVICIYQDRKAGLWLATDNDGVYTFDGSSFVKFRP